MNAVEGVLRRVTSELAELPAPFALVGGFAVSVRSAPRFTADVDLAVAVDSDAAAEGVVRMLTARGYEILTLVEQYRTGRLATVRLLSPTPGSSPVGVDLLFASSGIEPEVAEQAAVLEILPGLSVPVAAAGHLVVLKLLARDDAERPQDAADLRALALVLDEHERARARKAADLVTERGFDRGRDLPALLDAYLSRI